MHFVNEQDDVAVAANFLDDALDSLLEFAAVLGAGNHSGNIQCQKALVPDGKRHTAADDFLRKPFDDRRLADARLADQAGIVLVASRQNLDHTLHFLLTADHRIEFSISCFLREVPRVLLEHTLLRSALFAALRSLRLLPQIISVLRKVFTDRRQHLKIDLRNICSASLQKLDRHILPLQYQSHQKVLGSDFRGMIPLT